jgi:hypothetical protein
MKLAYSHNLFTMPAIICGRNDVREFGKRYEIYGEDLRKE